MKAEAKLITLMSILDESIARIFLQETPLREAIKASIDLDSLKTRVFQLEEYAKTVQDQIMADENVDLTFLIGEVKWSLCQCLKYLELLKPTKADTDNLYISNAGTVRKIIQDYQQVLARILKRFLAQD